MQRINMYVNGKNLNIYLKSSSIKLDDYLQKRNKYQKMYTILLKYNISNFTVTFRPLFSISTFSFFSIFFVIKISIDQRNKTISHYLMAYLFYYEQFC
jgi:hypothetical protein